MTTKIPSSVHACVALLWLCFWWIRETQFIISPRLPPFRILVHKKAASLFSEAYSLQAWQPLSPGPAPHYYTHSVTTVGSSSSAFSAALTCVTFPLSLPACSLLPAAGLAPFPAGLVFLWTIHVIVTCIHVLPPWADTKLLENRDEILLTFVHFALLPCWAPAFNMIDTHFKAEQVR